MIIEFLTLKLTMDAIVDHVNNIARQQELADKIRVLKAELLKIATDYEAGKISKETFSAKESQITSDINSLVALLRSSKNNKTTYEGSSNLGSLTGLL